MAGGEAPDALSKLINAARKPGQSSGFGGCRSISEQVASRITVMIKSAISSPAIICRPRAQMGIAFAISRPPLREALKALTLMGVLKSRQGGR